MRGFEESNSSEWHCVTVLRDRQPTDQSVAGDRLECRGHRGRRFAQRDNAQADIPRQYLSREYQALPVAAKRAAHRAAAVYRGQRRPKNR